MTSPATENQILHTLSGIIVEALRVDPDRIKLDTRIFLDLGAESIDIVDIRFRIEHAFGFKMDQDEMIRSLGEGLSAEQIQEKFTVGSLVDYIRKRLKKQEESS
jgi:acyl carrier protein